MAVGVLAIISICLFVLSVRRERRRFANIILLIVAAGLTSCAIGNLTANGWLYTHLISYMFFLFAMGCGLFAVVCLVASVHYYCVGQRRNSPKYLGAVFISCSLVWLFYYYAGTILFRGVIDSILQLVLLIAVYLSLAFLGLICYTFLAHLMPTRTKWDYIFLVHLPMTVARAQSSLRHCRRLDDIAAVYHKLNGKACIILPNEEKVQLAALYLIQRGVEEDMIRILSTEERTWRMRLSALVDPPANIKPYHTGLVWVENYLACHTQHELARLGLHGMVVGYPSTPARWAVGILREYRAMAWVHRIGIAVVFVWWLILCSLSLWW